MPCSRCICATTAESRQPRDRSCSTASCWLACSGRVHRRRENDDRTRPRQGVHATRKDFQAAIQHKFIEVVELLSGRVVLAFISNYHVGPDLAVDLFMLEPTVDASR